MHLDLDIYMERGEEKLVQEEMPRGMEMNALWLLLDLRIDLLLVHSSASTPTKRDQLGLALPLWYIVCFFHHLVMGLGLTEGVLESMLPFMLPL